MSIPGLYFDFNILPYKSVELIMPESRRTAFLQQVQAYYNERRIDRDSLSKDHAPYFQALRELDVDPQLELCDLKEANKPQKDEWIQGIIDQRKVMLKAFKAYQWEEEFDRNASKQESERIKLEQLEEELKTKTHRERREDFDYEQRKELIYAANKAVWKFKRELRAKARNEKVKKV